MNSFALERIKYQAQATSSDRLSMQARLLCFLSVCRSPARMPCQPESQSGAQRGRKQQARTAKQHVERFPQNLRGRGSAPKSRPGRGASTSGLVQRAAAAAQPDLSLSCEDVAKGEEGLVLSPESSKPTADHCSIRRVAFAVSRCMHYADLCVSWVS